MRTSALTVLCLALGLGCAKRSTFRADDSAGCTAPSPSSLDGGARPPTATASTTPHPTTNTMQIKAGSIVFTATLCDNEAGAAFKAMLPLTLNMVDLNANEKYYDLPHALPRDPTNPGTINAGEVMLYGSNTVVLFYETFATSYSYTPIAKIDDPSRLAVALGAGNVTVTFSL